MNIKIRTLISLFVLNSSLLWAQPEVSPWSNISGIRVDGELMELNSSLGFVGTDWSSIRKTAKERARYNYQRDRNTQFTPIQIDSFFFDQSVEDLGAGMAHVRIQFRNGTDTSIIGTFFMLQLPWNKYGDASVQLIDPAPLKIANAIPIGPGEILRGSAKGLLIMGVHRNIEIEINDETQIIIRKNGIEGDDIEVFLALMTGNLRKGTSVFKSFTITCSGLVDRSPVKLVLDRNQTGRPFKGFGGNFRLQNPTADPPVIDYCLENLDVRYGRVEMPWWFWHPEENVSPVDSAKKHGLHPRVEAAMEMAQRLHKLGMPVILSAWFPPAWAVEGELSFRQQPVGLRGNALDQSKINKIYSSIADYIQFAKDHYGFEFVLFSFNESDLGINVRQTDIEHASFIKGMGAHLRSRGLGTKLLLGDTADADGWPFIEAAMNDPGTHQYIDAVSFHSWRGYTDENLQKWADAAEIMDIPLLIGEGSMDAGAWRYPDIFSEYTYAMEEANLYTRILKICQPQSILQWQLTADYSPMIGGGVFGNNDIPLTPTQRLWNFKQIADIPEGLFAMPAETDNPSVICAGLGDNEKGVYAIHIVNNGASRPAILEGLPASIQWMKIFVTNENSNMAQRRMIRVRDGIANFSVEANSFITLLADGESPF